MKTYICLNCGEESKTGRSKTNKYCSNKCQKEYEYKQRILEWKQTGSIGKGTAKKYLAEQKEGCYTCGITEWNGKEIVLELEHVDGDSSNNAEENLSLICPNCHSQTSTYKNRNKGNGRHARRERYAQGLSY